MRGAGMKKVNFDLDPKNVMGAEEMENSISTDWVACMRGMKRK